MIATDIPFIHYADENGQPLDGGYLYFGLPNQNPETAPITVYWDADGTQPAAQPIRTLNGFAVRSGNIANVFSSAEYSIAIKNAKGELVCYSPTSNSLAAPSGSSLVGYLPSGATTSRTAESKLREIVSVEDFEYLVIGGNWAPAIQAAINTIPSGGAGKIALGSGKIYNVASQITVLDRTLVFDGNQSTINLTANATYALSIEAYNCEFRNFTLSKSAGVVVTAGVYAKGLQHVFRNITSRSAAWPVMFHCDDLKESHFSEIRVDLDTAGLTGTIFKLHNYCLNSTITDSFLGYCAKAIHAVDDAGSVEGWLISDTCVVYADIPVRLDQGTFFAINNCMFDFCGTAGVLATNGQVLSVKNTWISSRSGIAGFIGVNSALRCSQVSGCTFVRNNLVDATGSGVNLTGPNSMAHGNNFIEGMNGGNVTQSSSQVYGNSFQGGGTVIASLGTITGVDGNLVVTRDASVRRITSLTSSAACPSGVATTVMTLPTLAETATYIISLNFGNGGDATNFSGLIIVVVEGATSRSALLSNGGGMTITLSGLNIRVLQGVGISLTATATATRIA